MLSPRSVKCSACFVRTASLRRIVEYKDGVTIERGCRLGYGVAPLARYSWCLKEDGRYPIKSITARVSQKAKRMRGCLAT